MQEELMKKTMTLVVDDGIVDGKVVFKRYTYSNLDMNAAPGDLYAAASALSTLYAGVFAEVQTIDTNTLSN